MHKKIISVVIAVLSLFVFSISSYAVVVDDVKISESQQKATYTVNIHSKLDGEKEDLFVMGSTIKVYKLVSDGSNLQTEAPYIEVKTDNQGEASISVAAGSYIIRESNFELAGKEYGSEDIKFTLDENSGLTLDVYLKHSLVNAHTVTVTEPKTDAPVSVTESTTNQQELPFTGSKVAVSAVVALLFASVATTVTLISKKYKNIPEE